MNINKQIISLALISMITLTACGGGGGGTTPSSSPTLPVVSISDSATTEGDSGTADVSFSLTMSGSSAADVSISYTSADGSAIAGTDYSAVSGTLVIPTGDTTATIVVSVNGETLIETDETFNITLSNPINAALGTASATGTIINDDFPVLNLSPGQVLEGNSGNTNLEFVVSLSDIGIGDISVDYATSEVANSAVAGADYLQSSGTLTIPEGDNSGIISIPVIGDINIEADEVFTLSLSNLSSNAVLGTSQAAGTILNDDLPQLSITSNSLTEGNSGSGLLNFAVSLDAPASTDVSIDYASSDGTATLLDNDYTATSGTLVIPTGSTTGSIAVEIIGDGTPEPNETFALTLSNLTGNVVLANAVATGTIANDDTPIQTSRASVSGRIVVEGDTGDNTDMVFTVIVDPPSSDNLSIRFSTTDIDANSPADYTAVVGNVLVPANSSSASFSINIVGDNDVEGLETFLVDLERIFGPPLTTTTATGFIVDNDSAQTLTLSVGSVNIIEGDSGINNAVFNAVLNAPSAGDVSVDYQTEDVANSAIAGSDYTASSGVLTIPAGELLASITVPVIGDTAIEADEQFRLALSNITGGAVLGNTLATATIQTDDPLAEISLDSTGVAEGDSGERDLVFTLLISAAADNNVVVDYTTSDGTATLADGDYTSTSGTLIIPPGDTSATINVPVQGDLDAENDEVFLLTLSNASGNALLIDTEANGTIVNDDGNAGWSGPEIVRQDRTTTGQALIQPVLPRVAMGSSGLLRAIWVEGSVYSVLSNESTVPGVWTTPEQVSPDSDFVGRGAQVFVDNNGNALSTWRSRADDEPTANQYTPGVGWETPAALDTGELPQIQLSGDANSGEAFAVWEEFSSTSANGLNTIWASRFVPGSGWLETAPINPLSDNSATPQVAVDTNGVAMVVWNQFDPLSAETNIVAYRYNRSSNSWDGPDVLDNGVAGESPREPTVAVDEAGNAIVAWLQGDFGSESLWANRYSVSTGWAGPELIQSGGRFVRRNIQPDVAIDANGNAFVVWLSQDIAAGRRSDDLWVRRYDSSLAVPDWEAARLLEFDDTADTFFTAISGAQVVADNAGNAIAVWSQDDGSLLNARAARYSITDGDWEPAGLLEELDTGASNSLHLVIDRSTGNAAAVWQTGRPDPFFGTTIAAIDIWINRFTAP